MKCKLTLIKKENTYTLFTYNTSQTSSSNGISTLISFARVFNGEFLFLGLLAWFHLSTGDNKTDVCKKNLETTQTSSKSFE